MPRTWLFILYAIIVFIIFCIFFFFFHFTFLYSTKQYTQHQSKREFEWFIVFHYIFNRESESIILNNLFLNYWFSLLIINVGFHLTLFIMERQQFTNSKNPILFYFFQKLQFALVNWITPFISKFVFHSIWIFSVVIVSCVLFFFMPSFAKRIFSQINKNEIGST